MLIRERLIVLNLTIMISYITDYLLKFFNYNNDNGKYIKRFEYSKYNR